VSGGRLPPRPEGWRAAVAVIAICATPATRSLDADRGATAGSKLTAIAPLVASTIWLCARSVPAPSR